MTHPTTLDTLHSDSSHTGFLTPKGMLHLESTMRMTLDFQSKVDGRDYTASIVSIKKRFHIPGVTLPGLEGMRLLNMNFDSFIEAAIYLKPKSLFGFLRIILPPKYLVEINDYLHPLSTEEMPVFFRDILENENIFYDEDPSKELEFLREKWQVMRLTARKITFPYFKKLGISFYMRE